MRVMPVDAEGLAHVIRHMRTGDREEIFACRFDDDDAWLAEEILACQVRHPWRFKLGRWFWGVGYRLMHGRKLKA